jgi:hypothetical protein
MGSQIHLHEHRNMVANKNNIIINNNNKNDRDPVLRNLYLFLYVNNKIADLVSI